MIEILAPPSKSVSHRALIAASLANGTSTLTNILDCKDTRVSSEALSKLGATIEWCGSMATVTGPLRRTGAPVKIYCEESGSTFRFITALSGLFGREVWIDGAARLRMRPIKSLLDNLAELGVSVRSDNGFAPLWIRKSQPRGGSIKVNAAESSQFVSGLLLSAPLLNEDIELQVEGVFKSKPYVDLTCDVMNKFGLDVKTEGNRYMIAAGQSYLSRDFEIEGDFSSAAYMLAASMLTKRKCTICGLNPESYQGDKKIISYLTSMGADIRWENQNVIFVSFSDILPLDVNLADCPDLFPMLAVLAAFADGVSHFTGVDHLRHKESDRLAVVAKNLGAMGIKVTSGESEFVINGGAPRAAYVETANDHRISMAFQVAGLVVRGVEVDDMNCVSKSFPEFDKMIGMFK